MSTDSRWETDPAFEYSLRTVSELGCDVTSEFKRFIMVVGEKHGRPPESCCRGSIGRVPALQNKYVLHLHNLEEEFQEQYTRRRRYVHISVY